jgi:hypothetical protein
MSSPPVVSRVNRYFVLDTYDVQFKSWFTKAQRAWLDQVTPSYIHAIKTNTAVHFVVNTIENFLISFPVRRTRISNAELHETRLNTMHIVSCCLLLIPLLMHPW